MKLPSVETMARNVMQAMRDADGRTVVDGSQWYTRGRQTILDKIAKPLGLKPDVACGMAAALSPACSWPTCLADTWAVVNQRWRATVSTYGDNKFKALLILNGADPAEVLGEHKVFCFWDNLMNPRTSRRVTVDRHAWRVAFGRDLGPEVINKASKTAGAYARASDAYSEVADSLGLLPLEVQAITWLGFKEKVGR